MYLLGSSLFNNNYGDFFFSVLTHTASPWFNFMKKNFTQVSSLTKSGVVPYSATLLNSG